MLSQQGAEDMVTWEEVLDLLGFTAWSPRFKEPHKKLLILLATRKNQVVSYRDIARHLWNVVSFDLLSEIETIRKYVYEIRALLGEERYNPSQLVCEKGGYKLRIIGFTRLRAVK